MADQLAEHSKRSCIFERRGSRAQMLAAVKCTSPTAGIRSRFEWNETATEHLFHFSARAAGSKQPMGVGSRDRLGFDKNRAEIF